MPKKTFNDKDRMHGTFTTVVDLETLTAAEGSKDGLPSEIPVLPKGEFMTLPYGNMVLNDSVFEQMIGNFKAGIRRAVPIDIDHSYESSRAAGWVKELVIKADGLWAVPDWNKLGKELVGDKIYKMISAEWSFDYVDPQKSTHHGAVLVAATLTNRPLMQSMPTITASEKNNLTNSKSIMILLNTDMPTLEDILKKPVAERNDDDKKFLEEHKEELNDDQKAQLETEAKEVADAEAKAQKEKEEAEAKAQKEKEEAEGEAEEAAEAGDVEACEKALVKAGKTAEEAKTAAEKMVKDKKASNEDVTIKASELARLQKLEADTKKAAEIKAAEDYAGQFMASSKGGKVLPAAKDALTQLAQSLNASQRELLKTVLTATADQKIEGAVGEDTKDGLTATEQYNKFIVDYRAEHKTATPTQIKNAFREKYPDVAKAYEAENK